ncbi:MAG: hypothetical protein WC599_14200, partial [Bacteroidales bacterium]
MTNEKNDAGKNGEDMEISRELFDHKDDVNYKYTIPQGLNEEVVRAISKYKNEPEWMLNKRLEALKIFNNQKMPNWGPPLNDLDLEKISYFHIADAEHNANTWENVPEEIKNTFERLGIPEAERHALAGAGAQYDSQVVYHNLQEELKQQGVIFEDMDIAVKEYPELIQKYFMNKCVPAGTHKFASLHGACWSGGTFIYIPKGVKVEKPLQAYFRMNAQSLGQFEHTLIVVDEGAECHYIEGCFNKGTPIKTFEGYLPIEEIVPNDIILTSEGRFKPVKNIKQVKYTGNEYTITLAGDSTQTITV